MIPCRGSRPEAGLQGDKEERAGQVEAVSRLAGRCAGWLAFPRVSLPASEMVWLTPGGQGAPVGGFRGVAEEDSCSLFPMNRLWRVRRKGPQSSCSLPDYRNMFEKCENTS